MFLVTNLKECYRNDVTPFNRRNRPLEHIFSLMGKGKQVIHFSDFNLDSDDEILDIHYMEEETANYLDETLKHQVIYIINTGKEYEKI